MSCNSVDADTPMLMDDLSWVVLSDICTHASSLCLRACAFEPVPSIADPVADDNENDDDTKLNQDGSLRWRVS